MAFLCKSERVLNFNPNDVTQKHFEDQTNPQLGPGTYFGVKQFSNTKQSLVPFQTSKVREISEVTNKNPGPGEYKKNKPGFNSKEARFNYKFESNQSKDGINLGPGQYDLEKSSWLRQSKNLQFLRAQSQIRNNIRLLDDQNKNNTQNLSQLHHSPPSIPSGDFRFGYKVGDDGYHVVSLKLMEENNSEKLGDKLGPGAYQNIDGIRKIRNNIIPYIKDTSKRTKVELDIQSKVIGPGSYDLLKPVMVPAYKYNSNQQSSMFASQTKRTSSVNNLSKSKNKLHTQLRRFSQLDGIGSRNSNSIIDIKSQNSYQLQLESAKDQSQIITLKLTNLNTKEQGIEEEEELDQDQMQKIESLLEHVSPGPGSYISQDLNTSFKKQLKNSKYQFFGSQVERFQLAKDQDNDLKQNLGPGYYQYNPEEIGKQKYKFKTVGFNTELQRFHTRDKGIPGPGHYKNTDQGVKATKDQQSYNRMILPFGFVEKRFVLRDNQVPGPGEYKPEKSMKALQNKKNEILQGSASFLAQDTERRIADPVLHHSPPVGSYNPDVLTIKYNQAKRNDEIETPTNKSKIQTSSRKVQSLRQNDKTEVKKHEISRFESSLDIIYKDRLTPIRGPGYYNGHEKNSMQSKKGNHDYFTQSKRFEYGSYLDKQHMKMAPGPGYYRGVDDPYSRKNRSFNLMFS
ncbi:UNKNOWN [Stylonychia lemnae]|uniref:Sperm-tail PG-rich repeat protein n=1 Tax=Stylonychia lemnae TaxID=5949 RepID=A0A078AG17_STYLE|nr:UNKNOWN [Stylonychia lemnae]|eukprot:CDW79823.1 UNKNOWN [Stylonychia lemnae]